MESINKKVPRTEPRKRDSKTVNSIKKNKKEVNRSFQIDTQSIEQWTKVEKSAVCLFHLDY